MALGLPPTNTEQRSVFYEDVESLISPGFLSHNVRVAGVNLSLRSLGPGDLFLLQARVGRGFDEDWKVWTIASSLWMVNGYQCLGDPNVIPAMAERVRLLPRRAKDTLFSLVLGLFNRQSKAVEATESYCYETTSRYRWLTFGGHLPALHSGVPRIDTLGTNSVQRMWAFFNGIEDRRHQEDTLWEGFKLSVSPHAPKGVKKIDQRDKQQREAEQERRQGIQDRFFYRRVGVLSKEEITTTPSYSKFSKSADDLEQEMFRWVAGEEDWHDLIVSEYKQRVVAQLETEKKQREERVLALRHAQLQEAPITSSLMTFTPEQLHEILKNRDAGMPGLRTVQLGGDQREFLYRRYLERTPDSGRLRPGPGGRLVVAEGADLTETISNRGVPFHSEREE
jgi:hypothetical protein